MRSTRPWLPLSPLERDTSGELSVEMKRVLEPPLARAVVHVDEAESPAVAEPPLEIIEQRPYKITPHRDALCNRVENRPEIVAQIRDAAPVVDPIVCFDPVGKRSPVLKDVNRQIAAVALFGVDHNRTERVWGNLPAHLGNRGPRRRRHDTNVKWMVGVVTHPRSCVMVNREIIRL